MHPMLRYTLLGLLALAFTLGRPSLAQTSADTTAADTTSGLAVMGDTVYTMAGEPIAGGVVLVSNGQIEAVGPAADVPIPSGYDTLSAKVVTPGLVDAHSTVGLSGIFNQPQDQDQLDTSAPIQPELRAIDAYNPREQLVAWLRNFGVTTVHTGHGPGALISGQTMVVKTSGATVGEAVVDSVAMVAFTLGPGVAQNFDSPGTRAKGVAMLRAKLLEAQQYAEKMASEDEDERPARNLQMETLADVLAGRLPALMTVQHATEIMSALRLAEEFGFTLVLDGAAEAYLVADEIAQADVPVILHPTMVRTGGEQQNASFETAATLEEAGIPFAFQSAYEAYVPKTRVVLFEAAIAAANGLPKEEALAAVTLDAARILGVDDRVGSLEAGKDADLVLFDGDPFEYTSHVCTVIIGGEVVSETCR